MAQISQLDLRMARPGRVRTSPHASDRTERYCSVDAPAAAR